ncbi:MAG: single-stranded-DNA-specific exonuclease RecJ [Gemmatimonadetes bacterium]|nr:single-stranded-DNA-specific exonuclease RecJ [Gemmatimonadota bacterium]
MIRLSSRWRVAAEPAADRVAALAVSLTIPPLLARLLVQRGYDLPNAAKTFLRPSLDALTDPFAIRDMDVAVDLVASAVRSRRTIMVHGDYDVDGQCATALLTRVLRAAGASVVPFVPHRIRDGYDFGPAGLAAAQACGATLIITCDCGTTAHQPVAQARAAGMGVIVTDHHLPGVLPAANAVLNPQRPDGSGVGRELCGTGVAFKLAQALCAPLGLPQNLPLHLLDLVALATVADIVPLTGENRVLTRHGLRVLASSRWLGVRALIEAAGLGGRPIRSGHVGFVLGPRLNAAGRVGDAMDGVRLLLSDDENEARALALRLEALNERRQAMDQEILEQAAEDVEKMLDPDRDYTLVVAREGWHPGVIGIVASRIVERYGRPAILLAIEGEHAKGSGRSISRFNLHEALQRCADHLTRFGGHRMAAGLTLRRDRLESFREAFNACARECLTPEDLVPTQHVDLVVTLRDLDFDLEKLLRHLEPCGAGNPSPVFGVSGAVARDPRTVGDNHIKFTLDDSTGILGAIGFDWADRVGEGWLQNRVDVAFRLELNEFRGVPDLQGRVVQLRPAG